MIAVMALVFITGAVVLLYPFIRGFFVDFQMEQEAHAFLEQMEHHHEEPTLSPEITVTEPKLYQELWDAMTAYNAQIWEERQAGLCDPWSYQQPSFDLTEYELDTDIFAVLSIPALSLEMPVYLGATNDHMAKGAAHLSQTSLPIGGADTNCVIAGHRGWSGASYFRYLDKLKVGDEVTVTNLWETLEYRVCEIEIIQPNDIDAILIQPGREVLTLLTCHPYASGGRQRYVVYCERVT